MNTTRTVGLVLAAVVSVACRCGSVMVGQLDSLGTAVAAMVLLTTGIAAFVASTALFALPRSRQG